MVPGISSCIFGCYFWLVLEYFIMSTSDHRYIIYVGCLYELLSFTCATNLTCLEFNWIQSMYSFISLCIVHVFDYACCDG